MSATNLQIQGRQAYKRGDYDKALECFNRALDRQQTVQLYDQRAATYDKLADFKKALQDAKAAIRSGDVDPTGYLRAGKILLKMEKSKAALDVYAYGLRHVKHVGQGFEQLQKCHDDLLAELAPTNSVDPLTVLPIELATSILEYCTFKQRVAMCRVSRGWQRFIRSSPNLWTHLDLGAARSKVKTTFISVAINTAKDKLTAATLSKLFDFDKVLTALLRHCPLESLTLAQTGLQGHNLVSALQKTKEKLRLKELKILEGTEVSQTTLREAATACQGTLEVLHCWWLKSISLGTKWNDLAFPKLRVLNLTADRFGGISLYLKQLLARSPELTSLVLINTDFSPRDTELVRGLDLRDTRLEHVSLKLRLSRAGEIGLPESVESLRLEDVDPPGDFQTRFFLDNSEETKLQLHNLPNLRDLHLDLPQIPFDHILAQLQPIPLNDHAAHDAPPLSKLRTLHVHMNEIGEVPTLVMPLRLKELHSLALHGMWDLTDEVILRIVKELPLLRSLDVSGSRITGAGVGDLLRMNQLTELRLNECHDISHRDAIDQARKRGVRVEYRLHDGWRCKKLGYH